MEVHGAKVYQEIELFLVIRDHVMEMMPLGDNPNPDPIGESRAPGSAHRNRSFITTQEYV